MRTEKVKKKKKARTWRTPTKEYGKGKHQKGGNRHLSKQTGEKTGTRKKDLKRGKTYKARAPLEEKKKRSKKRLEVEKTCRCKIAKKICKVVEKGCERAKGNKKGEGPGREEWGRVRSVRGRVNNYRRTRGKLGKGGLEGERKTGKKGVTARARRTRRKKESGKKAEGKNQMKKSWRERAIDQDASRKKGNFGKIRKKKNEKTATGGKKLVVKGYWKSRDGNVGGGTRRVVNPS